MRLLLYKHKSVMKRILFMIILGLGGLMPVNRTLAQRAVDLFQAYSWEQASLQAARENKLVLVEVGPIDPKVERGIQTKPDLVNYLQRNVIAIRLNANDTKNSGFQTHLLMYEPPLFAFFMPYGDLLEMIKPEEVLQDPSALRETLEKAKERAAVKKRNSRSVRFEDLPFEEALAKAEEAEQAKAIARPSSETACITCIPNWFLSKYDPILPEDSNSSNPDSDDPAHVHNHDYKGKSLWIGVQSL